MNRNQNANDLPEMPRYVISKIQRAITEEEIQNSMDLANQIISELEYKDSQIRDLTIALNQKIEKLNQLDEMIRLKDEQIRQLDELINQKEMALLNMNRLIEELDRRLEEN